MIKNKKKRWSNKTWVSANTLKIFYTLLIKTLLIETNNLLLNIISKDTLSIIESLSISIINSKFLLYQLIAIRKF